MKRSGFSHLVVQNYQSIVEADVPLGPLTVIVGDNDAGKSALLRAIRAACFNETGTGFINHEADKTTVELSLYDGVAQGPVDRVLCWRKKREGGATYDLWQPDINGERHPGEGQHFSKLGASVPPEIRGALAVVDIEVDKTYSITPQVHRQGEYAFLIDRSEGQAARALAKMTKLDVVVEAQGLIRADFKRTKAELKATKDNIEVLEAQMREFDGLDEELHLLENVSDGIGLAECEIRHIENCRRIFTQYALSRAVCEEIGDLPSEEDIENLKGAFNWLRGARRAWLDYGNAVETAAGSVVPDIPDFVRREALIRKQRAALLKYMTCNTGSTLDDALDANGAEYKALVVEWNAQGVCSACGAPVEKMK